MQLKATLSYVAEHVNSDKRVVTDMCMLACVWVHACIDDCCRLWRKNEIKKERKGIRVGL